MSTLSKITLLLAIFALRSEAIAHSVPEHEHQHELEAPEALQPPHEEIGIKLPFDPLFCDLNRSRNIEVFEMREDNLCLFKDAQFIFSPKPISALGLKKGQLLLTIDDGPHKVLTPQILDLLDAYGIKATFFIVGRLVNGNEALLREMIRRGHTIGNHTFTHNVSQITPATIVGEVTKSYDALTRALGQPQAGRLLFRAPGLGWSAPKAVALNDNPLTRTFIGPIHANLGTDAPRADWACWQKGVSSETCAAWYFQDTVNAGRGIVLTHDIYYKPGKGNTFELLKIYLKRLHNEAGGIKNRSGQGLWEFVDIQDLSALDQFETERAPIPAPVPTKRTADGYLLIERFTRTDVYVRSEELARDRVIAPGSLIPVGARHLKTSDLDSVADLEEALTIGSATFKRVRVESTKPGLEALRGTTVYIWTAAF